jgi:glutaredoxin
MDNNTEGLALYDSPFCGFCTMTKRVIGKLNLDIEYRNIQHNNEFRRELIQQGGKAQVPCLRIDENDQTQWLYESADIIKYLNDRYG